MPPISIGNFILATNIGLTGALFSAGSEASVIVGKVKAQRRTHSKSVPLPDYTNQKVCGITVHFLPCDEVVATTSCYAYSSPEHPVKVPLKPAKVKRCQV